MNSLMSALPFARIEKRLDSVWSNWVAGRNDATVTIVERVSDRLMGVPHAGERRY